MTRKNESIVSTGAPVAIPREYREKVQDRHRSFLEYYTTDPETRWNIFRSAIKAGFSRSTASTQGKSILLSALRRDAKEAVLDGEDPSLTQRVGLNREQLLEELRYIVMQRSDLRSKLKAMQALLMSEDIDLREEPKTSYNTFNSPVMIQINPPKGAVMPEGMEPVLPPQILKLDPKWREENEGEVRQ